MRNALHFVGFRGSEYNSAVKVFGEPDIVHVSHDLRFLAEVAEGDKVVFANHSEKQFTEFTYDDSKFV